MKPCDCKSISDYDGLCETGISYNQYKLHVADGTGVLIEIDPHVRIRIPSRFFKRFAEWYLTDQEDNPTLDLTLDKSPVESK